MKQHFWYPVTLVTIAAWVAVVRIVMVVTRPGALFPHLLFALAIAAITAFGCVFVWRTASAGGPWWRPLIVGGVADVVVMVLVFTVVDMPLLNQWGAPLLVVDSKAIECTTVETAPCDALNYIGAGTVAEAVGRRAIASALELGGSQSAAHDYAPCRSLPVAASWAALRSPHYRLLYADGMHEVGRCQAMRGQTAASMQAYIIAAQCLLPATTLPRTSVACLSTDDHHVVITAYYLAEQDRYHRIAHAISQRLAPGTIHRLCSRRHPVFFADACVGS